MNNDERREWVLNDEGLFNWFCDSHVSMKKFIEEHKDEIDKIIANVTEGRKPAHYLAYGG